MNFSDRLEMRRSYGAANLCPKGGRSVSPYSIGIDWIDKMSPIEKSVWSAIRYLSIPLFPQYPVGRYFLDFGDPVRKIGIEVDSVRWHKDKTKDAARQREIEAMGWRVFRIPSHIVHKTRRDFMDEEGGVNVDRYATESAEGILWNIYLGEKS